MKFVETVKLMSFEEVLARGGVRYEDTGLYKLDEASIIDWLNPEELHMLGKEVDVYIDEYDVMYDLILKDVEYDEDSMDAIYALTSYEWLVKED